MSDAIPSDILRCSAVLTLLADRWRPLRDQCELPEGHDGEHSIAYTSTNPPAHMRWSDPTDTCFTDDEIDGIRSGRYGFIPAIVAAELTQAKAERT